MNLLEALQWRYAAKRMNGQTIPEEKLDAILEATRLSASSMGLQPYKVLVIRDEDLRKQIQQVAYGQAPIVEGSHLLVFAAYDNISEQHIVDYINHIAAVRGIPAETLDGFKGSMMKLVTNRTQEQNHQWAARQTYIAFGTAIAAAAEQQVDATPMEGFLPEALDDLLHLREQGLRSVTLLALGYRDAEKDALANARKVRREPEDLIVKVA